MVNKNKAEAVIPHLFFCGFSLVCVVLWWRGTLPFPFLGGDTALHASYAAAIGNPEAFGNDVTLFQWENFSFFRLLHIPLLLAAEYIFGDFGTGFLVVLFLGIILQMSGFYLLGIRLIDDKYPALFLAIASTGFVNLGVDYWGVFHEFEPRVFYQGLFPFLILAFVKFRDTPALWPGLFVVHGILIWVHPPSVPIVALSTLVGLICFKPKTWSFNQFFVWSILCGLSFLISSSPFAFIFVYERPFGETANYQDMIANYKQFAGNHYLDAFAYLNYYMGSAIMRYVLPVWGFLGAIAVYLSVPTARRALGFLVITTLSVCVFSIGISYSEQVYSEAFQKLPLIFDFIRGFRYSLPLMLTLAIWGTSVWFKKYGRGISIMTTISLCVVWIGITRPGSIPFRATWSCFLSGQFLCPSHHMTKDLLALNFIKYGLPNGAKILPIFTESKHRIDFVSAIRYYSYKPVLFSFKDICHILYDSQSLLPEWIKSRDALNVITSETSGHQRARKIAALGSQLNADYIVTDLPLSVKHILTIGEQSYGDGHFLIIRVNRRESLRKNYALTTNPRLELQEIIHDL